jgi:hypothetical protein
VAPHHNKIASPRIGDEGQPGLVMGHGLGV